MCVHCTLYRCKQLMNNYKMLKMCSTVHMFRRKYNIFKGKLDTVPTYYAGRYLYDV